MAEKNEVGILAFGAYLPRLRLSRKAVADANAWFAPGLKGLAKGERTMCNWDEDSVTMARRGGARLPHRAGSRRHRVARLRLHHAAVRGPAERGHHRRGAEPAAERQRAGSHRVAARGDLGADHRAADGARRRRAGAGRGRGEAAHPHREPAGAAGRRRRGGPAGRDGSRWSRSSSPTPAARSISSITSAARASSSTTPGRSAGSATRATTRSCRRRWPTCSRRPT